MKRKIYMIVLNNVIYDARVLREAKALSSRYEVQILGIKQNESNLTRYQILGIKIHLFHLLTKNILPKNTLGWSIKYLEFILKLNSFLLFKRVDFFHAHDLNALLPIYLSGKLKRAKIIYDSHELFTEMASKKDSAINRLWFRYEKHILPKVDAVIAANLSRAQVMKDEYGAFKLPYVIMNIPAKYIGNNNCVKDNEFFNWLENKGIENKKVVLYQGGISQNRNLDKLVQAAEYFNDNLVLVFLGKFETERIKQFFLDIIEKRHIASKVFFHKRIAQRNLLEYTKQAYIGIVIYDDSSRNNYLCAPNKLFEYASVNLPIAGVNFPEVKKIIEKYKIGKLFDGNLPKDIARAVNEIDEMYTELSKQTNFKKLFKEYNWNIETSKLLDIYKTLEKKV